MNSTKETYAAIRKALATLDDPFTRFLEPTQYAALRRGTAGSVTGVGLEVGFDTKTSGSGNSLVVQSKSCMHVNIKGFPFAAHCMHCAHLHHDVVLIEIECD